MTEPRPSSADDFDVIVIGAGAAGLLAAARAAERGRRTLLLEKNSKPGVKILMSGGTRCNLTHACDSRGIVEAFGAQGRFLHSSLAALSPQGLIALFEAEGVATKVEESGKVFPRSDKALHVLEALLRRVARSGAVLEKNAPIRDVARSADGFRVASSDRHWNARHVLLTTGGQSYPGCGTTGDGYRWARSLGHTIVSPRPALVPVTTDAAWVHSLKGITVPDVGVRVVDSQKSAGKSAKRGSRRGSFLMTHVGVSGPAVLDVSREITGHAEPRSLALECDFLPDTSDIDFDAELRQRFASEGKKSIGTLLPELLPRRLGDTLLIEAGVPAERRGAEVGNDLRGRLVQAFKHCRIPVSGTLGFPKAEVTAGGISLDEVDSRTMMSRIVPGLFLAGEVLDLDGPIGGYNFQAAFSTGWLAAGNI